MFFMPSMTPGLAARAPESPPDQADPEAVGAMGESIGLVFESGRPGNTFVDAGGAVANVFRASRGGPHDQLWMWLPGRRSSGGTNYYDGDSGILRITVRAGATPGTGQILWQSPPVPQPALGSLASKGWISLGNSDETMAVPCEVDLVAGNVYQVIFENLAGSNNDRFSINHNFDRTRTSPPHANVPFWQPWRVWRHTGGSGSWGTWDRAFPLVVLRHAQDGVLQGNMWFEGGNTNAFYTQSNANFSGSAIELTQNIRARQRFLTPDAHLRALSIELRAIRRNNSTANPLRVVLEREEASGGVTTMFQHDIPASQVVRADDWPNVSGLTLPLHSIPLPDQSTGPGMVLEPQRWYRLVMFSSGSSTRYGARFNKLLGFTHGLSRETSPQHDGGRGEYSSNGGSTWRGAFIYGSDNRNDLALNIGLRTQLVTS